MAEITDCKDLDFSDWENFTDDIDVASLEYDLQKTESSNERFNDKILNFLSEGEFHCPESDDIIPSSFENNTLYLNQSCFGSSHSADILKREPATNLPRKMDSKILLPFRKDHTDDAEKSDILQSKCYEKFVAPEYPNICGVQKQDHKYSGNYSPISGLFDIQAIKGSETIVSSNQKIMRSEITSCKNVPPFQKDFISERKISPSEENLDSQKMVVSSQEILNSQKMVISSQESMDSQPMIISSQETNSDSQKMIISSQESSSSEKMIISSQEFSDTQKMILSSQDSLDDQRMIILSQGGPESPREIESRHLKFQFQTISSQESFSDQKVISSQESFDSKNLIISNQVAEGKKILPSGLDTAVGHQRLNCRSSFLKISKKINLKTDSKSYPWAGSRLSLKNRKFHKFLHFKSLSGGMTTQCNGEELFPPASIAKKDAQMTKRETIQIEELKVRKIDIGMHTQEKFITS